MTVYIEYALLENFILDGTLVYLTLKILRLPVKIGRLLLSATLGAIFAVVFPLFSVNAFFAFVVRYLFGVVICSISLPSKSLKIHALGNLFFYLFTFAFGGLLLGMYAFFEAEYQIQGGYFISNTPVSFILIFVLLFMVFCIKIFEALHRKYSHKKLVYQCEIQRGEGKVIIDGLYDTGNFLTFHGVPVCLLDRQVVDENFPDILEDATLPNIYIRTATGEEKVKIFQGGIKIYLEENENIIDKAYFALSPAPLQGKTKVILPAKIFQTHKENRSHV